MDPPPIAFAALSGNIEVAEERLRAGADINFVAPGKGTALHVATRRGDLDMMKWLIANGAEPISWDLCEEFLEALAPHGLKRNTMLPVYGLAEATVGVAFSPVGPEYERVVMDQPLSLQTKRTGSFHTTARLKLSSSIP